jgi:hypothetical protein
MIRTHSKLHCMTLLSSICLLFAGCETNPAVAQNASPAQPAPPIAQASSAATSAVPAAVAVPTASVQTTKSTLQFIDLQSFDRDLHGALTAPLPQVDITFYDRITPSTLPERIQKWMASVENGGGSVKITPPPSTVTAKNPFLLLSAASSLWSANKMMKEAAVQSQFKSASTYDANVVLKVDDKGDTVVDKLVFTQRVK